MIKGRLIIDFGGFMKTVTRISIFIFLTLISFLFLDLQSLWAAKPVPEKESPKPAEVTKPSETGKKSEKFIVKGREYCYECIDNSECLGCHTKISERKFAQSVHGANSCNSCHWDITDVKAHVKAKGAKNSYGAGHLPPVS